MTCAITPTDKIATAKRIAAVTNRIIDVRTGGRYGGRKAEVEELARELGCSSAPVWTMMGKRGGLSGNPRGGRGYYATNVFLPRLDVVIRLCQVAGISADWLLLGTGRAPGWWYDQQRAERAEAA